MLSGIFNRGASSPVQAVKEIIGRSVLRLTSGANSFWSQFGQSVDQSRTDYKWWDNFRRGKQPGYEFSGLFAKPIAEILASWVIGESIEPRIESDEYTENLLQKWFKRIHRTLLDVVIDLYGLGDQYIAVNPDGSLSIISPELVHVDYMQLDYRQMERVTVTTVLPDAIVTDMYTVDQRVVVVKWTSKDKQGQVDTTEYQNLIGKIPIVHLANDRSGNETNGRPTYEALRHLFSRYSDLMSKMVDGSEIMGNPIPVIEGVDDIDETVNNLSATDTDTFTDADGNEQSRTEIYWDRLGGMILGSGAHFKFGAPNTGFTKDIRDTLETMFILVMEHTRVPEAVWGLELSSARSTAIEQMKTFHMYITQKRLQLQGLGADSDLGVDAEGGLLELCDIWLRMRALTDRRVKVAPVTLKWSNLAQMDEQLEWQKNESAHNKGVITDETYLSNLHIVENALAEVEAAADQMEDESDRFEQDIQDALEEDDPLPEVA